MPRSAVQETESIPAKVSRLHKEATQIEQEINKLEKAGSTPKNTTQMIDRARPRLCEAFSDILLYDPESAVKYNVCKRLFDVCFYSRIKEYRKELARAQKKSPEAVAKFKNKLMEFLSEGIGFYNYLIERCRDNLLRKLGYAEVRNTQTQTENSSVRSESIETSALQSSTGHVACLMQLYVCLGDLYRYSESKQKSSAAYLKAAHLGPGHGQPFNQLGVLTATNKSDDISPLHWYARSLGTPIPFSICRGNLERHLTNVVTKSTECLATSSFESTSGKDQKKKRFFALFAILQNTFCHGFASLEAAADVWEQIDDCTAQFIQMLQSNAFSDALITKVVTLQAFMECFVDRFMKSSPEERDVTNQITAIVARIWTLQLGHALGDRIVAQRSSSIRLVAPFWILCEYVASRPLVRTRDFETSNEWSELKERHQAAAELFVSRLVDVLNHLPLPKLSTGTIPQPVEYQLLRGFGPFSLFCPQLEKDGLVTEEEAGKILTETAAPESQRGMTQTSQTSSAVQSNTSEATTPIASSAKLTRVRLVAMEWVENETSISGGYIRYESGSFALISADDDDETDDVRMNDTLGNAVSRECDDGKGDARTSSSEKTIGGSQPPVVFQEQYPGGPKIMVFDTSEEETAELGKPTTAKAVTTEAPADKMVEEQANSSSMVTSPPSQGVSPASAVLPPPGFGVSIAPGGVDREPASVLPRQPLPPPQQCASSTCDLFGGSLVTDNPFAKSYQGSCSLFPATHATSLAPVDPSTSWLVGEVSTAAETSMDGASLLGSGLLESLWMTDQPQQTKNPFATTSS